MGRVHADCFAKMENAELVAVSDAVPEASERLASIYGIRAFSSAEQMIDEADFDVLDICLPTFEHARHMELGALAGKHICCEKPMCRTLDECRKVISACHDAGVSLFIAHVVRWFPEFRRAKDLIQSGAIGSPSVVRTSRGGGTRMSKDSWFASTELSGGVVLDTLIHDFDWLLWTFGPVERVFARGLAWSSMQERDHALVTLRFKNGVIGHVEGTWAAADEFRTSFEVAGDGGLIDYSSAKTAPLAIALWSKKDDAQAVTIPVGESAESPYFLELKHFIDCLDSGCQPDVSPEDAMAAVEVALAAVESVKTGSPVVLR